MQSDSPLDKSRAGYFQCGYGSCRKSYNRADHLIRHVRSHTREKPYVCQVCNKGFSRPDLLKRHAAGHSHPQDPKRKRLSLSSKNGRVSQACKACATSKLKCDEEKPCRRCRDRKLFCDYQDGSEQHEGGEPSEHDHEQEYSPESEFSPLNTSTHMNPQLVTPDVQMDLLPNSASLENMAAYDGSTVSPLVDHESGVFSVDGTFFPEFIPDSLVSLSRPGELDPSAFPPNDYYAHRLYDHNMNFDFDLTEVDFGLIDFYNSRGSVNPAITLAPHQEDPDTDRDSGIALGAEAYRRSSLSAFQPTHQNNAFADQADLSVPKSIDSPEASVRSERHQILSERLSPGGRDLIFGMVLQTSQRANLSRIMKSFPSTELLDSLIQEFFFLQREQVDSWIHAATFDPNEESPDMAGIVAAAAAVRSEIPTIRKLGYALMEVVRLQMSTKYENDNTTIRDLRASQTFALTIDIGMWSGSGRRTEIAESFQQPLLTMLRRGLRFRRSVYTAITPLLEDSPDILERKWREWAEQESFKRLVHHLYLHDAQSSLMLNTNPLISYADLELPLPMTRSLWEATSPSEWRDIYIATTPSPVPLSSTSTNYSSERLPSLVDTLRDMSSWTGRIDTQLSGFVILHGLSALINEYHKLKFIAQGNSKHWSALVINSRQQELAQVLSHFRMISLESQTQPPMSTTTGTPTSHLGFENTSTPPLSLLYSTIQIFLHISLSDLQLFAGKEDKRSAALAYNTALDWINSSDSRKAIWHAGQVLRAARDLAPGGLSGFLAVGVYYASLVFWGVGVVGRVRRSKGVGGVGGVGAGGFAGASPGNLDFDSGFGLGLNAGQELVFLDGDETPAVQKFISLGRGTPALQNPSGPGPAVVSEPSKIMDVARGLLIADKKVEALPPLVQGLWTLMGDLGRAAG